MKVAGRSDVGKRRNNNEDKFLIDQDLGIFLLADGMGGHNAGEVASDIAVKEAYAFIREHIHDSDQDEAIIRMLEEAMDKAHDAIREKATTDLNLSGMGTTLVELVVSKRKAFICHVGDSRAYLFRDELARLTRDHTVGNYLVERDLMPREAIPLQNWHTLTQAVGTEQYPIPDSKTLELQDGDIFLLCTDGLTDMLEDDEIRQVIQRHKDDTGKASSVLVEDANKKGGRDNITVVLVGYE
ncbi:MAG: protein phosphatase 2C domain-containing protein [Thermodesulfovibrionales bacterium]